MMVITPAKTDHDNLFFLSFRKFKLRCMTLKHAQYARRPSIVKLYILFGIAPGPEVTETHCCIVHGQIGHRLISIDYAYVSNAACPCTAHVLITFQ